MKLKEVTSGIDVVLIEGDPNVEIDNITYHSDKAKKGSVFVAIKGFKFDGHKFIGKAVLNGASVVVSQEKINVPEDITLVIVRNSRIALARLSENFFGHPSRKLLLLGVTGTNGKTTISYLMESILREAGFTPGVIGTIEYRYKDKRISAANTTPESCDLQKLLAEMAANSVNACVMEVSSHALALDRVEGCHFNGAVFTNLTSEHMDFHDGMESYFSAKEKLFKGNLVTSKKERVFAAINVDDKYGCKVAEGLKCSVIRYAIEADADVYASDYNLTADGIAMNIKSPSGEFKCTSKLAGRFNVYNILAAAASGFGLGIPMEKIIKGIEKVDCVPGRFEKIKNGKGVLAFVDYAHTPDALENVLKNARGVAADGGGKIILVFGCGGDRDKTKRPMMGEIASRLADFVIITNDNPRTEDPLAIINDISKGVTSKKFETIPDRKKAIHEAVHIARPSDVIVVAGKGHENYQILGSTKIHFDDREVLKECLSQ